MTKPKISVIIPVYNTGKFIKKCLQSILDQKIDDIEIIIVNDASTDDSLKVIKKFIGDNNQFLIIDKKENEGLEEARKSGIEIANGKYLCHVDSDDWLPEGSLTELANAAAEYQADIVVGNIYRVFDRFNLIKKQGQKFCTHPTVLDKKKFMAEYYINFFGVNIFPVSMCGKLYKNDFVKRESINRLGFSLGEDLNYNMQVFPKAEKIVLIPAVVYCYRYGGMTSEFNSRIMLAAIKMYNIKQEIALQLDSQTYNKYSKIELKNYLKTYIEMLLKFRSYQSPEEHKKQILEILHRPEFLVLKDYYSLQKMEGFELAFSKGDLDGMYQHVNAVYRKIRVQYKIKRSLSNFFT